MKATIETISKVTGQEVKNGFGIKTENVITYQFKLDFNDSNFGKKKGWLKSEGAKWDANEKVWVIKTKSLPSHLVELIWNLE